MKYICIPLLAFNKQSREMELEILGVPQAVCFDPHIQILGHWDNPVSWNQRPEKNQACRV